MRAILYNMVPAPGGIRLATDVYLPDGPGPFPTLVTRTPYHRRGAIWEALRFTARGYAFVAQDCRGRYDSGGALAPLQADTGDGRALIDWVADRRWCNGRIGLQGISYLGITQIPAASGGHPAVKCIAPNAAPADFFTQWTRYNGAFALANATRWTISHASARTNPSDHFKWDEVWSLPSLRAIFDRIGFECRILKEWVRHDRYDAFWQRVDQRTMHPAIRAPGLHMCGWFDHLAQGTFTHYCGIKDRGATPLARRGQRLYIGPWGHSTQGKTEYGLWRFGKNAALKPADHESRFFDLHLKDIDDGIADEPPVRIFLMGANRWIDLPDWPPPGAVTRKLYLASGRRLEDSSPTRAGGDTYRYDPAHPTPTIGGSNYWGLDPKCLGPQDQRPIMKRKDVLSYLGPKLERPLTVIGQPAADLWISSNCEDTDLIAKLCVMGNGGRVISVTNGAFRCRFRESMSNPKPLRPGVPARIRVPMTQTAFRFPAGSRVVLQVTSSCFPRILPNPNTMEPTFSTAPHKIARNTILFGGTTASALELPVLEI